MAGPGIRVSARCSLLCRPRAVPQSLSHTSNQILFLLFSQGISAVCEGEGRSHPKKKWQRKSDTLQNQRFSTIAVTWRWGWGPEGRVAASKSQSGGEPSKSPLKHLKTTFACSVFLHSLQLCVQLFTQKSSQPSGDSRKTETQIPKALGPFFFFGLKTKVFTVLLWAISKVNEKKTKTQNSHVAHSM
jgi:hypothetical protein